MGREQIYQMNATETVRTDATDTVRTDASTANDYKVRGFCHLVIVSMSDGLPQLLTDGRCSDCRRIRGAPHCMRFHRTGLFGDRPHCDHQDPPCYCKPPLARKSKRDPGICSHCFLQRDGLGRKPPFCNCNPILLGPRDPSTPDGLPILLPGNRCVLCKRLRGIIPTGYMSDGEEGCNCYPPKQPNGRCGHCNNYDSAPCCSGIPNIMDQLCKCNYVEPPTLPSPPPSPPSPPPMRLMPSCVLCGYRRIASATEPWIRDGLPCTGCGDITIQTVPLDKDELKREQKRAKKELDQNVPFRWEFLF